jgi:hypothetical protein
MKGRRQKCYEYLKWVQDAEKELERIELLWSLGIVKSRDERKYYTEVEPYYSSDLDFTINALRIIR